MLLRLESLTSFLEKEALVEPTRLIRAGSSISSWLDSLASGLDGLQSLVAWDSKQHQNAEPLASIIAKLEAYESRRLAGDHVPITPRWLSDADYGKWWEALVRYTASLVWQKGQHQKYRLLDELDPTKHERKVRALKDSIAQKRNLEADTIKATWLTEQIEKRDAPWDRIFQLNKSKFGDAKRLREAIALSLPEGLLAMRPCWLVNPSTAAEIFPLEPGLFDLVIFDEASQCPVEHAVPAVFRGKAIVVSGDEKQLPPTIFFRIELGCRATG